jgi:hypothetical protein
VYIHRANQVSSPLPNPVLSLLVNLLNSPQCSLLLSQVVLLQLNHRYSPVVALQ